ncbi:MULTISPECIES: hypothetical protein [unclassified Nocardioides]|uniref:hypothetical protein n=1 Tax=Nocardioides sp. URHA0032 TaxID=1380388 RepID=UPI0004917DEE|nr:hypothetical protein [Nocardioides sp. URHA0032]
MTTLQDRPVRERRPHPAASTPTSRRERDEPRRAPTVALSELMGRRPDLHDVYPPATIAADSILWSA